MLFDLATEEFVKEYVKNEFNWASKKQNIDTIAILTKLNLCEEKVHRIERSMLVLAKYLEIDLKVVPAVDAHIKFEKIPKKEGK